MKVAKYEVPGKRLHKDPSRRVRYDRDLGCASSLKHVPAETDLIANQPTLLDLDRRKAAYLLDRAFDSTGGRAKYPRL
jgi:hypothetical protein